MGGRRGSFFFALGIFQQFPVPRDRVWGGGFYFLHKNVRSAQCTSLSFGGEKVC